VVQDTIHAEKRIITLHNSMDIAHTGPVVHTKEVTNKEVIATEVIGIEALHVLHTDIREATHHQSHSRRVNT